MEVFRKGLQVSIRETCYAWGRVFFVGLDCCEIVVVGGRLGEDLMELRSSCFDVGYVRDGFPDEIGEMFRDHKVCDMSSKGGLRFDNLGPIRVVMVKGPLVMSWAAVSFEFGRGHL